MRVIFLSVLILVNLNRLFAQPDFSLNLAAGQRYSFSTLQHNTIIEKPYGAENKTETSVGGSYRYTVLEKRDTSYLMRVEFAGFNQDVTTAESKISYSSVSSDTVECMNKVLKRVINKPFNVVMDKEYNWREVTGLDAVFREAFAKCATTEAARQIVDSILAADMGSFIQDGSAIPMSIYTGSVKMPKEVWTDLSVSEHVVPTEDSCSYLAEIYGDNIVVKGSGTSKSLEKEIVSEGQGVSYFLNGSIDYKIVFDKKSKWITSANMKTVLNGHAKVRKAGSILHQTIPMTIVTETTITGSWIE